MPSNDPMWDSIRYESDRSSCIVWKNPNTGPVRMSVTHCFNMFVGGSHQSWAKEVLCTQRPYNPVIVTVCEVDDHKVSTKACDTVGPFTK